MNRQIQLSNQESRNAVERKMNVKQTLHRVGHNGNDKISFDILKFETQLAANRVESASTWYVCLKEAITSKLLHWVEASETQYPHSEWYGRAIDKADDEEAWQRCYLYAREAIVKASGAVFVKQGTVAWDYFKSIKFAPSLQKKDILDTLSLLAEARTFCVYAGVFNEMNPASLDKELDCLNEKIPIGTELYKMLNVYGGGGGGFKFYNFPTFVDCMRVYADSLEKVELKQSSLPLQGRRFQDGDGDQNGDASGQGDSASVASNRMNDYRQTGGALSNHSRGKPPSATPEQLAKVPLCQDPTCKGHHQATSDGKCGPKELAEKDNYRGSGGMRCDYITDGVQCLSMNHTRKHHKEWAERRGSQTRRFSPTVSTASQGHGDRYRKDRNRRPSSRDSRKPYRSTRSQESHKGDRRSGSAIRLEIRNSSRDSRRSDRKHRSDRRQSRDRRDSRGSDRRRSSERRRSEERRRGQRQHRGSSDRRREQHRRTDVQAERTSEQDPANQLTEERIRDHERASASGLQGAETGVKTQRAIVSRRFADHSGAASEAGSVYDEDSLPLGAAQRRNRVGVSSNRARIVQAPEPEEARDESPGPPPLADASSSSESERNQRTLESDSSSYSDSDSSGYDGYFRDILDYHRREQSPEVQHLSPEVGLVDLPDGVRGSMEAEVLALGAQSPELTSNDLRLISSRTSGRNQESERRPDRLPERGSGEVVRPECGPQSIGDPVPVTPIRDSERSRDSGGHPDRLPECGSGEVVRPECGPQSSGDSTPVTLIRDGQRSRDSERHPDRLPERGSGEVVRPECGPQSSGDPTPVTDVPVDESDDSANEETDAHATSMAVQSRASRDIRGSHSVYKGQCEARARRSQSEPRRERVNLAGSFQYAEPLKEISLDVGFNCVVHVKVGKRLFKVCLDTGGSRSLIRKSFLEQLKKGSQKGAIVKEERINPPLHCQGVCEGMKSSDMNVAVTIDCQFQALDPDGHAAKEAPVLPVMFAELENAADALLIGCPEIVTWGCRFFDDQDGNVWVDFTRLGFCVLAESKQSQS